MKESVKILANTQPDNIWNIDLDYSDKNIPASFFSSESNIHNYPAKAVPEMVHDILIKLKDIYNIKTLLDPFVGSGTVALEAKTLGLDFFGSDLNPLAILIASTKALTIKNTPYVKRECDKFVKDLKHRYKDSTPYKIENFNQITYWFKEENIKQLSYIKNSLNQFLKSRSANYKKLFAHILLTAFSSTIRESSLSRNGEFKLYRMPKDEILKFNVDSLEKFESRMLNILDMIKSSNEEFKRNTITEIYLKNAKDLSYMNGRKVDLILTSPPYGDSKTTVAYGQFSRLPIQWISDLLENYLAIKVSTNNCDEYLLGGRYSDISYKEDILDLCLKSSENLRELMDKMDTFIKRELEDFNYAKESLFLLEKEWNRGRINLKINITCEILLNIIKEKLRLLIKKRILENHTNLSKKRINEIVKSQVDDFFVNLNYKKIQLLLAILPSVRQTINLKILSLPKRIKQVLTFFADLYRVVIECDEVLSERGLQVWIVGHRTVLGKIKVDMSSILIDWFRNLNYVEITSMKRKCQFKRMPNHINSTYTRKDQIQTMMEEYIIVVQKALN